MPPKTQCANPLFLQWLEELRDQAREKGIKVADVYNKGCRSLAACPVAYARPRELVQLQGIGPKTVAILEKRLQAHCKETGMAMPESPEKRRPAKRTENKYSDDSDGEDVAPAPPKRRKSTKVYIPQRNSGAYGILLGLLLSLPNIEVSIQEFLTKGEIIRAAQPFCDSSYDHAERGGFATAWNGMKTLTTKGYVLVQGSPHRYCLTEDGFDVAVQLRNMHQDFAHLPKLLPTTKHNEVVSEAPRAEVATKFEFWYIDAGGKRVAELQSAKQTLCPAEFVALRRIEFLTSQRSHPIVAQLRMVDHNPGSVTLFGFIVEELAPPRCSCFSDRAVASSTAGPSRSVSTATLAGPSSASVAGPSRAPSSSLGPSRSIIGPRLTSQMPLIGDNRNAPVFNPDDAIVFPQGSYEVILVIDTREVESRSNRDKITESLLAKGINVEKRALRLGDMCWVARRRTPRGGEEDECVLDYVIERKRLDDLCSSIRDGRYTDQCFRLGQSGIGNVFYVVEAWQTAQRMEFHGKAIMTAKSQIQVVNRFFLKETLKLNDTIDWLATMTRVVIRSLGDLHVIPSRHLSRPTYAALQSRLRAEHPGRAFLTSYEAYQALNDKSASRTLREGLARMLLCIKGMSPERVAAVIDVWETPRALYEAMVARHAEGARGEGKKARLAEHMFADDVPGEGRRKIGDAQSKALWKALWGESQAAV